MPMHPMHPMHAPHRLDASFQEVVQPGQRIFYCVRSTSFQCAISRARFTWSR